MLELDADIVKEFVTESGEMLEQLERELIALEHDPSSSDTLASLFRSLHTIKGAAGFMGLTGLGSLAHSGESVLSDLRDGSLKFTPLLATALLALSDCIRKMLSHLDRTGSEGDVDSAAILAELVRLQDHTAAAHDQVPARPVAPGEVDRREVDRREVDRREVDRREVDRRREDQHDGAAASNVRVRVERLDALMNLVGELVIARNEIAQLSGIADDASLSSASQRLNTITTQLQEGITQTRLQPIDHAWGKLPRVVRDAAQQCGKRVRLEMHGKDTELDRTLIEAIQDPLTHVLRNCVDHGLEVPAQRIAAGKSPEGCLTLRAFHDAGQVTIEVSDDGAGLNVEAITRTAVSRRLITSDQALAMADQDLINLIFLAGLSTAATVTAISGRGVGMDVVKTNIERIGGTVTIHSERGVGTTLRMRIPLTLAIINTLVVRSAGQCYAIPQANIAELVRLDGADGAGRTATMPGAAVYPLRGELLPLVWLSAQLTPGETDSAAPLSPRGAANIVVLQAEGHKFGLVVDGVNDAHEIVAKPLGSHLRGTGVFAGATILGDGRVALILDVRGLAVKAHVGPVQIDQSARDGLRDEAAEPTEPLLLFAAASDARMAVPLAQIARLEEFAWSSIERGGGRWAVPYRGDTLPLADILSLLPPFSRGAERTPGALLPALVYENNGRRIGVVVEAIFDVVDAPVALVRADAGRALAESIVISGQSTPIVDLDALCAVALGRVA
jgi:two-component system chemotaxis sensor kinase CheA